MPYDSMIQFPNQKNISSWIGYCFFYCVPIANKSNKYISGSQHGRNVESRIFLAAPCFGGYQLAPMLDPGTWDLLTDSGLALSHMCFSWNGAWNNHVLL